MNISPPSLTWLSLTILWWFASFPHDLGVPGLWFLLRCQPWYRSWSYPGSPPPEQKVLRASSVWKGQVPTQSESSWIHTSLWWDSRSIQTVPRLVWISADIENENENQECIHGAQIEYVSIKQHMHSTTPCTWWHQDQWQRYELQPSPIRIVFNKASTWISLDKKTRTWV